MPNQRVKPADGCLLVEDLEPAYEKQLISTSSLDLSGTNPHDQLKLGKVLDAGGSVFIDGYPHEAPAERGAIVAFQSLSAHALRIAGKQYRLVEFDQVKATVVEEK